MVHISEDIKITLQNEARHQHRIFKKSNLPLVDERCGKFGRQTIYTEKRAYSVFLREKAMSETTNKKHTTLRKLFRLSVEVLVEKQETFSRTNLLLLNFVNN